MASSDSPAPRDPLADALVELREDFAPATGETEERYWLRVGLTLGLRRPGRAGLLLDRLEGRAGSVGTSAAVGAVGAVAAGHVGDASDDPQADETDADPDAVPLRSMLLARAALLPIDEPAETAFGWVGRLTAPDITYLGRVVAEQIASGGSADLARGFGLAWTAGVHLPNTELNVLFSRFTDLQLAVASVLGGQDLRGMRPSKGFDGISSAIQGWFMPKRNPSDGAASAIFEAQGKPAQHGLIAVWNAWAAVRFRDSLPPALVEQLTKPWVTVIGRLPEP